MPEFIAQHTPEGVDDFVRGYLEAAEWLLDDDTPPGDGGIEREWIKGWHEDAIKEAQDSCETFRTAYGEHLAPYIAKHGEGSAGHDLFLSRNGHGAGFSDRGNEPFYGKLQTAARHHGSADTYLGDDGYLRFM